MKKLNNFISLGYLESTIPGRWVVEKLGIKANLRSFGLDLKVWQKMNIYIFPNSLAKR